MLSRLSGKRRTLVARLVTPEYSFCLFHARFHSFRLLFVVYIAMYLDPQTKIDMSLDDIIYHEKQHQRYIARLLEGRQHVRQLQNGYNARTMWTRNTPYRKNSYWQQHYRSSLNRVKWFYQGQKYFSYRSRFQNWNRVKNWATQQRLQNDQGGGGERSQAHENVYDDGISDCVSTFSSVSKNSRYRSNRKRRASSSLNVSIPSLCSSDVFKRPEIPYSCPRLNNFTNLVIKINNSPRMIERKFSNNQINQEGGRRGRGGAKGRLTLNERFSS